MPEHDRIDHIRREQGRALVRALHVSELEAAGAARNLALHQAELQLDRIARLLPDAIQGGLTLAEIGRITGVSRPTLYQLRGRYGDASDLRLAVLQTVANRGAMPTRELADLVGRDPKDVAAATNGLFDDGLLEPEPVDDEDGNVVAGAAITDEGLLALRQWTFWGDEDEIEP
jgi:hypothetical protein